MVKFLVCDCAPGLDTTGGSVEDGESEGGGVGKLGGGILENG
jgi:hypothetical protein